MWEYLNHIHTAVRAYNMIIVGGLACAGLVTAFAWGFILGLSQAEIENDETG